eukprot:1497825-Pleurochrysis_carterae.AAC.2
MAVNVNMSVGIGREVGHGHARLHAHLCINDGVEPGGCGRGRGGRAGFPRMPSFAPAASGGCGRGQVHQCGDARACVRAVRACGRAVA